MCGNSSEQEFTKWSEKGQKHDEGSSLGARGTKGSRGERQASPMWGEAPLQTLVGRQEGAGRSETTGGLLQLEGQGACCRGSRRVRWEVRLDSGLGGQPHRLWSRRTPSSGAGPPGSSLEKTEAGTGFPVTVPSSQCSSSNTVSVHTTAAWGRDKSRGGRACWNSKHTKLGRSQANLSVLGNKRGGQTVSLGLLRRLGR